MKKKYVLLILLTFTSFSQLYVEKQSGVNTALNSASTLNPNCIWTCGENGVILRIQNGTFIHANGGISGTVNLKTIWAKKSKLIQNFF